jgi:hypothetical protein
MKKDSFLRLIDHKPALNSVRFICSLSGGKLQLIKKQRVAIISPPGEILPDKTQSSGSWIELRQSDGKTLYRQIINDPLDENVEVLTGNEDQPFTWKKTKGKEKIIVLLAPEVPGAESLVVLKTGSEEKLTPVEIARFPVK